MNLIYYRGLNCYLACIVNIAAFLGVNYLDAFATAWSETDFSYDPKHHIFSSHRVLSNLEALGAKIEELKCSSEIDIEEFFARIGEREYFFIGMDTIHIPWSPVYRYFHSPHYFIAQKLKAGALSCFDPTYSVENAPIAFVDILMHVFELGRIFRTTTMSPQLAIRKEAQEILRKHHKVYGDYSDKIHKCKNNDKEQIIFLIRQIDAMISNRYLFRRFLHQDSPALANYRQFFGEDFFSRWEAVKNGLYKASIMNSNRTVVDEVLSLFQSLILEEIDMAEKIIQMETAHCRDEIS